MKLQRHSTEWHEALDAYVLAREESLFSWGCNDCCSFAADWVLMVRGSDPMRDLRGYDDARKAFALLRAEGGLRAAVERRMGDSVLGAMARAGDVALVRHGDNRRSMGICVGPHIVAPSHRKLAALPLSAAEVAWRV